MPQTQELARAAARLVAEHHLTDFGQAKRRAAQQLAWPTRQLPGNDAVHAALIEYQRLFGGPVYARHLRAMRTASVHALKMLSRFSPRLVGGTVDGAVTPAHRVQIHAFPEQPETLDVFLMDQGIPFEADDREFRYPDGRTETVPRLRFEAGEVGIDLLGFPQDDLRRVPISPQTGRAYRRVGLAEAEKLAEVPLSELTLGLA